MINTKEFFEALYPNFNKTKTLIDIRPIFIRSGKADVSSRAFFSNLDDLLNHIQKVDSSGQHHVFFECAELKPGATDGEKDSIFRYSFLFSDVDPVKKDKQGNVIETYTKDQLIQRIRNFPLPPSIIVDSGSGFHCYWLLSVPLSDKSTTELLLGRIQELLQGDAKAKLLTQLLRVPYTHNRKNELKGGKAIQVIVVEDNCRRFTLGEIYKALNVTEQNIEEYRETFSAGNKAKVKEHNKGKVSKFHDGIKFNFNKTIPPLNITIDNFPDLINTLKSQNILIASNMPDFPLGQPFNCCFHDDTTPSANVYIGRDGKYYYKCFGCDVVKDIIQIYRDITHEPFSKAIISLAKFFGINFKYQDWIIGQWEKYYHNSVLIDSFEQYGFDTMYPNLYSYLSPRIKYLTVFNNYAFGKLSSDRCSYNRESLFFVSYDYFSDIFGRKFGLTASTAKRAINLFATLNLIKKVPLEEVPPEMAAKSMEQIQVIMQKNYGKIKTANPPNYYIIHNLNDVAAEAEEIAKKLKKNLFKISNNMNKTGIIVALGQDTADDVYHDDRTISKESVQIAMRFETTMINQVSEQGYTTKDQVISKTKLSGRYKINREQKERELDRFFAKILNRNNFEYVRANKQLMSLFDIKKSVYIIIPKGLK